VRSEERSQKFLCFLKNAAVVLRMHRRLETNFADSEVRGACPNQANDALLGVLVCKERE
jgi:hypothetical protein